MYYGSSNGVFRMYPAATDKCVDNDSTYDPRVRPWYVAASSGPKDIVLVLDTRYVAELVSCISIIF